MKQSTRTLISAAAFLLIFCFAFFVRRNDKFYKVFTPQAIVGNVVKGVAIVAITDHRGQKFLMDYIFYEKLMDKGGYSEVIKFYYTHPSSSQLSIYSGKFKPINSVLADDINKFFYDSYYLTMIDKSTYNPTAQDIRHSIKVNNYSPNYSPSNADPQTHD